MTDPRTLTAERFATVALWELSVGSSKSDKKEKFQSWKIIALMTFIQGESSPCQSVFIYVCPRTFMVMCHYEVSLVLIRGVFFTPTRNFCSRETEGKEKGMKKEDSGGKRLRWGRRWLRWEERNCICTSNAHSHQPPRTAYCAASTCEEV